MSKLKALLAAALFGLMPCVDAVAAEPVGAREPITYRDAGIYGWWQPYFWEGPYDFIIVQAIILPGEFGTPGTNNASTPEAIKVWNESLMKARAAGKRVLVVVSPGQGEPYTPAYEEALKQFLDNVNHEELYGITLGEENITAPDWIAALSDAYYKLKKDYPDLPVYQWYSCSHRASGRPGFKWPLLPSDGWVADEYVATPDDFEDCMRRYRMLGLPIINIVWASPFYSSSKQTGVQFHDTVYDGQLRMSEKYAIPTAYFVWDGPIGRAWPWEEAGQEENKKLYEDVLKRIGRLDSIPDERLADWDKAIIPAQTVLEKADNGAFVYRESFDLWDGAPGTKAPAKDFMDRADIRGLRNMHWAADPSRVIVHSDGKNPVDASLTSHWVLPEGHTGRLTASAKVEVKGDVNVILEVSRNGYDWVQQASATASGELSVELPDEANAVYTRLRVSTADAVESSELAAIDWIEVKATR